MKFNNIINKGIRFKLIISFLIPVILIVVLGIMSYSKASKAIIASYEDSYQSNINMMAEYYNLEFKNIATKAFELNSNNDLMKYYAGMYDEGSAEDIAILAKAQNLIKSLSIVDANIDKLYLIGEKGKSLSSSGKLDDGTFAAFEASDDTLPMIEAGENSIWLGSHPFVDSEISKTDLDSYSISFLSRFYDIKGNPSAYVLIDLKKSFVEDTVNGLSANEAIITGFITSDNREIVSTNNQAFSFINKDFVLEQKESELTSGIKYVSIEGEKYLFVFGHVETSGALLCTVIPQSVILEQVRGVKILTLVIVLFASFIAIAIGTLISSDIANTIKKTNQTLKMVSNGNLVNMVSTNRKDEFRVLGESINHMIINMKDLIMKMAEVSGYIYESSELVGNSTNQLYLETKNISENIEYIEAGITQQAEDSECCLTEMSNLADQINKVILNTSEMESIAHITSTIISDGMVIVDDLGIKARDTRNITNVVIEDIEYLERESGKISSIVNTINDIAEETNLLALNASIEAARAGKFGRGFDVVAQEIKKLAEQSVDSAQQIEEIITCIKAQTQKTVRSAKNVELTVSTQEQVLDKTILIFKEINEQVGKLVENLNGVVNGMNHIETAKNETLQSIESISATAQETAASTNGLNQSASEQLKAVGLLKDSAEKLGDEAKNLDEAIGVFTI